MAVSTIKAIFDNDVQQVWETIASLDDYSWRSDISKIEQVNEKQFVEYTKSGIATNFTITSKEPFYHLAFEIENDMIKGNWVGLLTQKDNQTEIVFKEDIVAKKIWIKPLIKVYLKRQQKLYLQDLTRVLAANKNQ